MREFRYLLINGDCIEQDITLPVLLNIGTQFETEDGTYQVVRVLKEEQDKERLICQRINDTPWLLGHIDKSEYLVMNKSLPVL